VEIWNYAMDLSHQVRLFVLVVSFSFLQLLYN